MSRVSNPGEGLALLLVIEAVEPGVVTNQCAREFSMDRTKKKKKSVERIYCHC